MTSPTPWRYRRSPAPEIVERAGLRNGMAPAAVAAEIGFADQSHLGRAFRRAFGVTPGCYRAR